MVIYKDSDLKLKINLNVVVSKIRIFTTNSDNYIEKTNIIDGKVNVFSSELQKLNSGVLAYNYYYNDGDVEKEGTKYTDCYLSDRAESGILHKDFVSIKDYIDEVIAAKLSGMDVTEIAEQVKENTADIKNLSFTVESTDTINLVKKTDNSGSWIEANVIVDPDENNLLKVKENGLYVDGIEVDQDWDLGTY